MLLSITGNKKGISLLEMTVSMTLLLIVLSLGFGIYSNTSKTFTNGEDKSIIQKDARHVADSITRELRYATSMDFVSSYPSGGDGVNNYIIFDQTNGKVILYGITGIITYITERSISSCVFSTEFKPIFAEGNSKILLNFNIVSSMHSQSYQLNSSVLLMNMTVNKTPGIDTIGIKYKKP